MVGLVLVVEVMTAIPSLSASLCWNPTNVATRYEVRSSYPGAVEGQPPERWDPSALTVRCASTPCCVSIDEFRPGGLLAEDFVVLGRPPFDSTVTAVSNRVRAVLALPGTYYTGAGCG
jgi:hypothetical protein